MSGTPPGARVTEAAVLAGGRSRRMGREKALVALPGGETLIARALRAVAMPGVTRRLVSVAAEGPSPALAAALDGIDDGGPRPEPVPDRRAGGLGPLAALEALLAEARGPAVLVVPVDAPEIPRALLEALRRAWDAAGGPRGIVCAWRNAAGRERLEPLCAVWSIEAAPAVRRQLDAGRRAVRELAVEPGVLRARVLGSEDEAADDERDGLAISTGGPSPETVFRNLNRPEDAGAGGA